MDKYVSRKKACEILGIHYHTLYSLVYNGKIETIKLNKYNVYNVEKYLRENTNVDNREDICYCRVSSQKQSEDLERQISMMAEKHPNKRIIKDIGSGLNFNRKGLQEIIKLAIDGKIRSLTIAYKDRLCRFGYELIEQLITNYSNGCIIIENKSEENTPSEEMTEDIIAIMNIYVAKMNGLRKYKNKIKKVIKKGERNL